jgi:hypothetical protein
LCGGGLCAVHSRLTSTLLPVRSRRTESGEEKSETVRNEPTPIVRWRRRGNPQTIKGKRAHHNEMGRGTYHYGMTKLSIFGFVTFQKRIQRTHKTGEGSLIGECLNHLGDQRE